MNQVASETRPRTDWHATDAPSVVAALESDAEGLSTNQAQARLAIVGPNRLPAAPAPSWWRIALRQFKSPLIYILAVAAALSLSLNHVTDAAFIVGVLVLNALIGGFQEWKAERSSRALQQLLRINASVIRDGEVCELDAEQLVPGDAVLLESGDRVPADLRLLSAHALEADESLLTGESVAVEKDAHWIGAADAVLGDQLNMAFAGSTVVRGRAKGIVVATGMSTQVGLLARDVMSAESAPPPLLIRLERFTRVVGVVVLVAAVVVATLGVTIQQQRIADMFIFAVALAVSAIPEGLPVAITVALAIATRRMVKRGVIVRRLGAVEGLGSCTLIATDKTGTLTCNELTVREVRMADGRTYAVSGEGFAPHGEVEHDGRPIDPLEHPRLGALVRAAVLCNEADLHRHDNQWTWRGDPTDVALLTLGAKLGWLRTRTLDAHPLVNLIPFESEHRFAATYHQADNGTQVFVKGAPERVVAMCRDATDDATLDDAVRQAEAMADRGYRVLALAEATVDEPLDESQAPPPPRRLTLLGLVGMIDPLRPGVREAVQVCHNAGIAVGMVTGDHPVTARAIARDLRLIADDDDAVVTGVELEAASDEQLKQMLPSTRVFARVAPHHKLRIVQAAQELDEFVAVTGDGVNDAPALRRANIGVAMGRSGTDVAREACDLVISDDNFATIVAGVEEGRIAYDNVRKVIYLLISTGAAEVVLVMLAVATGSPLPLLPVQLLWLNLVTNGIQHIGLAFEPGEGDVLHRAPRPPRQRIFNRIMIERTLVAALVMGGVGFAAFDWMLNAGWPLPAAQSATLLLFVLFENVHIGNCRSETQSAFRLSPLKSPLLLAGAVTAFLVHVAAMYTPIGQHVLGTEPIGVRQWLALGLLALSIFIAMELHKLWWTVRNRRHDGKARKEAPSP